MSAWSVYTATGRYNSGATPPANAFCQVRAVLGFSIDPTTVDIYEMDDGSFEIAFGGEIYTVRQLGPTESQD